MALDSLIAELDERLAANSSTLTSLSSAHSLLLPPLLHSVQSYDRELLALQPIADSLAATSAHTATLAYQMSQKVRELDNEQARIKHALSLVTSLNNLQETITSLENLPSQSAASQIEESCELLQKVFLLTESEETKQAYRVRFEGIDIGTRVSRVQETLKQRLFAKFDAEVASMVNPTAPNSFDQSKVWGTLKLLEQVGAHRESLGRYSSSLISALRTLLQTSPGLKPSDVTITMRHAQAVGQTVNLTIQLIQNDIRGGIFDPARSSADDCMMKCYLNPLIQDVVVQIDAILAEFHEKNNLKSLRAPTSIKDQTINLKTLDMVVAELVIMARNIRVLINFIDSTVASQSPSPNSGNLIKEPAKLLDSSLADYIAIETLYMRLGFQKAMALDAAAEEELVTTCIDDIFFVCKKCIDRSLSLCSPFAISELLHSSLRPLLQSEFVAILVRRLQSISPSSLENSEGKRDFMKNLNNLEAARVYLGRVIENIESQLEAVQTRLVDYQGEDQKASGNILSPGQTVGNLEKLVPVITAQLKQSRDFVFGKLIRAPLSAICHASFRRLDYVASPPAATLATESEAPAGSSVGVDASKLLANIDKIMQPLMPLLLEENQTALHLLVLVEVLKSWAKSIMLAKFNQMGALKLDSELRAFVSHYSPLTDYRCRQYFGRMMSIAAVLMTERSAHLDQLILDLQSNADTGTIDRDFSPKLSEVEVRDLLKLRIDPPK